MERVTCTAPVNIAVIKYWGKKDEELILPINSSVSVTLDQSHLRAKTTVAASSRFTKDRVWLNGEEQSLNTRIERVLKEIRRRAGKRKSDRDSPACRILGCNLHICSENNFPTAAGLASSAAGYACLVYSLAQLFGVQGEISDVARLGSGSACRSIYGGFVTWDMGVQPDGIDSLARQVNAEDHWSDIRVLILVVSGKKKPVGSSAGMQTSVKTSDLLKYRTQILPRCIERMENAIKEKDFQTFAELTMKDSNQLHAVCLDTYPPITYLTDTSRDIMRLIHAFNSFKGKNLAAYTFDAGPNACLYLPESSVPMVTAMVKHFFPPVENGNDFIQGIQLGDIPPVPQELLRSTPVTPQEGAIKYVISTKPGPGPQILSDSESLLDDNGYPKSVPQQSS